MAACLNEGITLTSRTPRPITRKECADAARWERAARRRCGFSCPRARTSSPADLRLSTPHLFHARKRGRTGQTRSCGRDKEAGQRHPSRRYLSKSARIDQTGISPDRGPAHRIVSVLDGPDKRPLPSEDRWEPDRYFRCKHFFYKVSIYKLSFRCTSSIDDSDSS